MTSLKSPQDAPAYYCVGFHWYYDGDEDHSSRFLSEGIWEHGFRDGRLDSYVNEVPEGALLALKTSHAEKADESHNAVLTVYNIGTVVHNPKDGRRLIVKWQKDFESFRLDGVGYRPAITRVKNKKNIRLIFFREEGKLSRDAEESITEKLQGIRTLNFNVRDSEIEPALGVVELADEFARLIYNIKSSERGNMVGVFGRWGRGKSFFINELLKNDSIARNFITIDFHAWKYQDTPASWAYLYEAFADKFYEVKSKNKLVKKIAEYQRSFEINILKHGSYQLIIFALAFILFFVASLYASIPKVWIYSSILSIAGYLTFLYQFYLKHEKRAIELGKKYFSRTSFDRHLGPQAEIQKELTNLLKVWVKISEKDKVEHKRILLVVEDIDRCPEDRIIQIVDSLRVMLDDPEISERVMVIAAVDERILKRAINWKYHHILCKDPIVLLDQTNKTLTDIAQQTISEYMDKLFLAGIKLNHLIPQERADIFRAMAEKKTEGYKKDEPEDAINLEAEDTDTNALGTDSPSGDDKDKDTDHSEQEARQEYELSQDEYNMLSELIRMYQDATPRQIRIFYYRYLLARNIVNLELKGTEEQEKIDPMSLAAMILHYTNNGITDFVNIKSASIKEDSEDITINIMGSKETFPRKLALAMYKALETVVAY